MTDSSPILGLPYIQPAQAQKHVTHNEALRVVDALIQLVVVSRNEATPPASVTMGERYLVATSGQGDWSGHDADIAVYDGTGWTFITPQTGWRAFVTSTSEKIMFDGTDWVADVEASVDTFGVNASADSYNRFAVSSDAVLLNHAGAGHQLKINKANPTDTSSLLFQTGYSGRAEMGTAGNDDFSIKVSGDGTVWTEALRIDASTGAVTMGATQGREMLTVARTYYVDPGLGSDAGAGLSAGSGAFATLTRAIEATQAIDAGGQDVTIQLADGTYSFANPMILSTPVVGADRLTIQGNLTTPELVVLDGTNEVFEVTRGTLALRGMRLQNSSTGSPTIAASFRGTVVLDQVDFGAAGGHLSAVEHGSIRLEGPYSISGDAKYHLKLIEGGAAQMRSQTVTLTGTPDFTSSFVICARCAVAQMSGLNFVGSATGRRYSVSDNAVVLTNDSGAAYFPGDTAGTTSGGGIYD